MTFDTLIHRIETSDELNDGREDELISQSITAGVECDLLLTIC